MASTPQFVGTPASGSALLSVANSNRDGSGTIATLITAGANGARVDDIAIKARATTTAGMIRFWLHDGTNYRFWYEVLVSAVTPGANAKSFETFLTNMGLVLPSGWSLRAATEKSEQFDVTITRGGSF